VRENEGLHTMSLFASSFAILEIFYLLWNQESLSQQSSSYNGENMKNQLITKSSLDDGINGSC
jgi:hypothetical protein